ncbi:diguanylate cyclase domain-containing protein [Legionella oakridgensis]|uniref:diguanylate cyclase domain-containing protein n=1 Tax=Legionella oakridgensis TaxID=29423 RepID=UPI0009DE55B6
MTYSIGIACYPEAGKKPEIFLNNADMAMYHVKKTGRNNYQLYTPTLEHEINDF